jgi:hypothetical protein
VFTVEAVAAGRWFFSVFSTNKTDRHDITEILLKVVLNTITITLYNRSNKYQFYNLKLDMSGESNP